MHRVVWMLVCLATAVYSRAQLDTKPLVQDVGVDEHSGQKIDLSLEFFDEQGQKVSLEQYFQDDIPVIIAPVYYSCPNLCTLVLNGVTGLIEEVDLKLGEEYKVLAVSFDPENTPELAREKAVNYRKLLTKSEHAETGWIFLTGKEDQVKALMDQIGFRYKWINGQYSHSSVIVLHSPDGTINRYVYGVEYPAERVRKALVEAGQGTIGSPFEQLMLYCFRYDPKAGKYVPMAYNIMRIGGILTLIAMGSVGWFLWRRELLNKRRLQQNV